MNLTWQANLLHSIVNTNLNLQIVFQSLEFNYKKSKFINNLSVFILLSPPLKSPSSLASMALYLSKSGKLLPHFKQKICSLGMISLTSIASCFSQNPPLSPQPPYAAPSLFASRRFGSVKAENLASITNTADSQVFTYNTICIFN